MIPNLTEEQLNKISQMWEQVQVNVHPDCMDKEAIEYAKQLALKPDPEPKVLYTVVVNRKVNTKVNK